MKLNAIGLFKLFFVCLSLSLLTGCAGTSQQKQIVHSKKSPLPFYYDALQNIEYGEYQTALTNLDSAIYYKPEFATFYELKGWVLEQLNNPDSAIVTYEKSLKYRSSYPRVWMRLGELYLNGDQFDKSTYYFRKAVQRYPDSVRLHLKLGEAYYSMGRYHLAQDYLHTYRKLASHPDTLFWKWQGFTYYKLDQYKAAIQSLENYVNLVSNDGTALKILGLAKYADGDYHNAVTYLNSAAKYLEDDSEIYLYRARYFLRFDKPEIAREQLHIGLRKDSSNVEVLVELGRLSYLDQRYEEAKNYFLKVKELNPTFWKVYRYLGFLAEKDKNLGQAREYYKIYLDHIYEEDAEVSKRMEAIILELKDQ